MTARYDVSDTPSLLVDLDRLEANLMEMAHIAADAGVRLRPHAKTHKSPWLALRQIDIGACGTSIQPSSGYGGNARPLVLWES